MIRHATLDDLPWIVEGMLHLKAHTGWSLYYNPGYNSFTLYDFLTTKLLDSQSVLYVWDPGSGPSAFCGGSLHSFVLPPHMPCVCEWGWFGSPRETVRCWQALCQWGRDHKAELAGRVRARRAINPTKITESITWKVL